jgi:hypothetical protein
MGEVVTYAALSPLEQSLVDALAKGAAWSPSYYEEWRRKTCSELPSAELDQNGRLCFPSIALRGILEGKICDPNGGYILIDARGALFRQVHFTGPDLDLTALNFCKPLRFEDCKFDCKTIILRDAKLDHVRLNDCRFTVLDARRITTKSEFLVQRTVCKAVLLHSARIKGLLSFRQSKLEGGGDYTKKGIVLECADIDVGGYVSLKALSAVGEVRFVGARIGSSFLCLGAQLNSGNAKRSLYCGKVSIGGGVYLRRAEYRDENTKQPLEPFSSVGDIVFDGAKIGAGFHAEGARIKGTLDLRTSEIGGSLHLEEAEIIGGKIPIYSLSSRDVEATGIAENPVPDTDVAVYGWNAQIKANVYMRSTLAYGEVSFNMATIGSSVRCEKAKFSNVPCAKEKYSSKEPRPALNFNNAHVGVSVFLNYSNVDGVVDFAQATINGRLVCTGARILGNEDDLCPKTSPNDSESDKFKANAKKRRRVFNCDSITVGGSVLLNTESLNGSIESNYYGSNPHFTAHGVVYFHNAKIGGDLDCSGGRFFSPEGASLVCSTAEISGSLYLVREFLSIGEVFLRNLDVGDNIYVRGGSFHDGLSKSSTEREGEIRDAIDLHGARVGKALYLTGIERFRGSLDLQDAHAVNFADDSSLWNKNWNQVRSGMAVCEPTDWLPDDSEIKRRIEENTLHLTRKPGKRAKTILRNARVRGEFTYVLLDRFTFDAFINDTRISDHDGWPVEQSGVTTLLGWRERYALLERQNPTWLNRDFRPQPFTQCAKAIAKAGRTEDARQLLYFREKLWLNVSSIGAFQRIIRRVTLGGMTGYGYRKRFALLWVGFFWLIGALIFRDAWDQGMIETASDQVITSVAFQANHKVPAEIEPFKSGLYALDVLLPVVDFGAKHEYIPRDGAGVGGTVRAAILKPSLSALGEVAMVLKTWLPKAWYWLDILTGWVLTTIIAAALAGLIGHQREE